MAARLARAGRASGLFELMPARPLSMLVITRARLNEARKSGFDKNLQGNRVGTEGVEFGLLKERIDPVESSVARANTQPRACLNHFKAR